MRIGFVLPLAMGVATVTSEPRRSVHFIAASHNLPDPEKAHRGGEDASFLSPHAIGTAGNFKNTCSCFFALTSLLQSMLRWRWRVGPRRHRFRNI